MPVLQFCQCVRLLVSAPNSSFTSLCFLLESRELGLTGACLPISLSSRTRHKARGSKDALVWWFQGETNFRFQAELDMSLFQSHCPCSCVRRPLKSLWNCCDKIVFSRWNANSSGHVVCLCFEGLWFCSSCSSSVFHKQSLVSVKDFFRLLFNIRATVVKISAAWQVKIVSYSQQREERQ